MNSEIDLRSVSIDFNSRSNADFEPIPNQNIRVQSTDYSKYLRTLAGINTPYVPCAVICIAFDLIFSLLTLVVGGSNIAACPIEPRIPIYLVVVATVNLTSISFTIVATILHIREKDDNMIGFFYVTLSAIIIMVLQLFCFIWLIVGTVWVFSIINQVQHTKMNEETYCQGNIYQYTQVSVILQYIIPCLICCCKSVPLLFK
jgi:hypothetical protein